MYLGIDFSGGAAPWKARCSRPSAWVATIVDAAAPRLTDLRPVQHLPGTGAPFTRLVTLLGAGDYVAAAIDAPFAIPAEHLPPGGHLAFLAQVDALPAAPDRPFPSGAALLELIDGPPRQAKPYRTTERVWVDRGIATRSTLWNGPRGGAPFTAACLTLLARAGRPIWPWNCGAGMLVEAFPAAQLKTWGLPHTGYGKPDQHGARERILDGLATYLSFDAEQRATMLETPDALDAAVAGFAAIAAARQGVPALAPADGLIAVMAAEKRTPWPARGLLHVENASRHDETFEEVLRRPGVRIERIVSRGQTTPLASPYLQSWDEWVLVLEGSARLALEGCEERSLQAGEHLLIPAGVPHRVTYTADPTIWLAVHFGGP